MGADYNFQIETTLTPERVIKIAANAIGADLLEDKGHFVLRVPGTFAVAAEESIGIRRMMAEAFGFTTTVGVTFEYYPNIDKEGGRHAISEAVSAMLHEVEGNAVLLYNGEETMLQRIGDELQLNSEWSGRGWLKAELNAVGLKYDLIELASPLLA